ncbi:extracellular solute-binding protein [Amnibacterium endophyticum]|uniref:Extracellular solute-binding protein n=1 Tax=Amnibacterium endophyticum TaxID=2109337 RepID=A0ABW4LGG2_9MICO
MAKQLFSSPMTRRGVLGAGLAAAAAPLLAACSSPVTAGLTGAALDPRTLVYWNLFGGGDGSRMQTMEGVYEQDHGGPSSLQATVFAWGNPYYSKLTLATVGNKPPDVAIAHLTRAKLLAQGGILDPITAEDLSSVGLSASDFNPKSWTAQRTGGKDIAIPLDTHPYVMFFNQDVVDEAGLLENGRLKTITGLKDFEAALAEISKVTGGLAITSANVNETATPWRLFQTLYNQFSGVPPYLGDDGKTITVDQDAAKEVLATIQGWSRKGWLNKALDYAGSQTPMFTGKAGFYLQGEWEITTAQSIDGLKFGMVPVPQLFEKPASQADSHTFVLPKKDRSPEQRKQAMGFIKSMLDQSLTWAKGGHIPAYLPVRDSAQYKDLEPQADYAAAAEDAVYDPSAWYSGSGSTFENTVGAQFALVQQDAISPEGALRAASDQLQTYLRTPSPL